LQNRNPYDPPRSSLEDLTSAEPANRSAISRLELGWFGVFALNLAFPLLFGWELTRANGRIGMLLAIPVLLAAGRWICREHRDLGRLLVVGGVLVGLSQVYPLLQMVAGIGGMLVGQVLGQVSMAGAATPAPLSQVGGFVMALTTGSLLMAFSCLIGYGVKHAPRQWWRRLRGYE
jgi:hypothetical protein